VRPPCLFREKGDVANGTTEDPAFPPGVGGAMDIAVGAKAIRVVDHESHRQERWTRGSACTYPLRAAACVKRIDTNLAVINVTPQGLSVIEMIPGMTLEELQALTEQRCPPNGRSWRRLRPARWPDKADNSA
jgi:3-oxoadipate CoA-transferase, beta subunit